MYPEDLKYKDTHIWVSANGDEATMGITSYASEQLGEIIYLDLTPQVGDEITADESFGSVESVKSISDLLSAVSGTVVAVNEDLMDDPTIINNDPFEAGWMLKIKLSDVGELDDLLDVIGYKETLD